MNALGNSNITLETFIDMTDNEKYEFATHHGVVVAQLKDPRYDFSLYTVNNFYVEIMMDASLDGYLLIKSYSQ